MVLNGVLVNNREHFCNYTFPLILLSELNTENQEKEYREKMRD